MYPASGQARYPHDSALPRETRRQHSVSVSRMSAYQVLSMATGSSARLHVAPGPTPQSVVDRCMSDADKEMLSQVDDTRAQPRQCGGQDFPAAAPLSWHCTLEHVAVSHSRDMGDHNFFSHTGSDGLGPADRITNAGYEWVVKPPS